MDPPATREIYFVASGGGGPSLFSVTLEEHTANVAKLRAWERAHPPPRTTTTTVRQAGTTATTSSQPPEHR